MTLDEIIQNRRSVRKYNEKKVEFEKVKEIIIAGMWAPTATNKQEYRFIYFDNEEPLLKISKMGSAHFIKNCHQAIMVLYDNRIDNVEYRDDILSAGAVIQNILLKAKELNIGTCWVCNLPSKGKLRKEFDIPQNYDPISIITLGYYDNDTNSMKRKHNLEDIMFVNMFDCSKDTIVHKSKIKLFIRKSMRMIYIRMPKNKILYKLVDKFEKKFEN